LELNVEEPAATPLMDAESFKTAGKESVSHWINSCWLVTGLLRTATNFMDCENPAIVEKMTRKRKEVFFMSFCFVKVNASILQFDLLIVI
jgi:hypothetical protein